MCAHSDWSGHRLPLLVIASWSLMPLWGLELGRALLSIPQELTDQNVEDCVSA